MLRGQRTFLNLFENPTPVETLDVPEKRGRNEQLIKDRNLLLLHRHYYHTKIKGVDNYQKLLDNLTAEFFLSERTVTEIVQANNASRALIYQVKPSSKSLEKQYPFMNWS